MHCKISVGELRRLLREGKDFSIINGKVYIPVDESMEDMANTEPILWYPAQWKIDDMQRDIQNAEAHPGRANELFTSRHIQDLRTWLDRIGQDVYMEFIDEPGEGYFVLYAKFSDGLEVHAELGNFWLELKTGVPDWRPDEPIPEDFYAL